MKPTLTIAQDTKENGPVGKKPEKAESQLPLVHVGPCMGSLSPLESSTPIGHIVSEALHDVNDALLGVHNITSFTRHHFHYFSDHYFGALSPTKLWVHPIKRFRSATTPTPP